MVLVPWPVSLSIGFLKCPYDVTLALQSDLMKEREGERGEEERSHRAFFDLVSKVTYCHFHLFLFFRIESLSAVHIQGWIITLKERSFKECVNFF